jgi:hypothetical protein
MKNKIDFPTKDKAIIGTAGVYFVASQLSLRGLIALPTSRNTAGIDLVVVNRAGPFQANLQVKTSRSRVTFWPVGKHCASWVAPKNYYVFVRYDPKVGAFEAFLEPSKAVAKSVAKQAWKIRHRGWRPSFVARGRLDRLRRQWESFGQ